MHTHTQMARAKCVPASMALPCCSGEQALAQPTLCRRGSRPSHKAGAGGRCGQGWGLASPVGHPAGHGPGRAGGDCPGSPWGRPPGPVDPGQPEEAGHPCGCCQPTPTEELTWCGKTAERLLFPSPGVTEGCPAPQCTAQGFAASQFQSHPTRKMLESCLVGFCFSPPSRLEKIMTSSYTVLAGHLTIGH